jgi:multidrug resistance protein, MATE family
VSAATGAPGRRTVYRSVLALGLPIVMASGTSALVDLITLAVIGRYSTSALAGVAAAVAVFELAATLVSSALFGHGILVSRAMGASDADRADRVTATNMLIGLVAGASAAALLAAIAGPVIGLVTGAGGGVVAAGTGYLRFRAFALPGQAIRLVLIRASNANRQSVVGLQNTIVVGVINLGLNVLLVFGFWKVHSLGATGSGIAGLVAIWAGTGFIVLRLRGTGLIPRHWKYDTKVAAESLQVSYPLVAAMGADYVASVIFFAIIGKLDIADLAASRVVFQVSQLLMMLTLGLSSASTILMSRAIGKGDQDSSEALRRYCSEVLLLSGALLACALLALRLPLSAVFSPDHRVQGAIGSGLLIVSLIAIPMAWTTGQIAILRAEKRTKGESIVNVTTTWLVQLPLAYLLALPLGLGEAGAFIGMLGYWITRGAASKLLVAGQNRVTFARPRVWPRTES